MIYFPFFINSGRLIPKKQRKLSLRKIVSWDIWFQASHNGQIRMNIFVSNKKKKKNSRHCVPSNNSQKEEERRSGIKSLPSALYLSLCVFFSKLTENWKWNTKLALGERSINLTLFLSLAVFLSLSLSVFWFNVEIGTLIAWLKDSEGGWQIPWIGNNAHYVVCMAFKKCRDLFYFYYSIFIARSCIRTYLSH